MGSAGQASNVSALELPEDDIDQTEGMTQKRGEATENNDKYRITVDVEQVLRNWFDEDLVPKAGWGIVSVVFVGVHFRMRNVTPDDRWRKNEQFVHDGVEVKRVAGEKVPPALGNKFKDLRDRSPSFWARLEAAGIEIYQQPAGFEDAVIACWKIERQGEVYICSMGLRDLFGGGLAECSREMMCVVSQLAAWIWGKMTAAMQVTDTDVAMRLKAKASQVQERIRVELIKLAEAEGTRPIFRCGVYEIMRTLVESIEELVVDMAPGQDLLAAMRRNGWLAVRPSLSQGTFVRADEQAWCQGFPEGNHRMRKSWLEARYTWLDEKGLPKLPDFEKSNHPCLENMAEQSYHGDEGCARHLSSWTKMVEDGEATEEMIRDWQDEPWFAFEVNKFTDLEGLEEYKDLMRTPQEIRKSLGIDEFLTSQRTKRNFSADKKKSREKYREALRPLRQKALHEMRDLIEKGNSRRSIAQSIIPTAGKKSKRFIKDRLRMHFAKAKKAKQAAATLEADKKNNESKEPTEPAEKKKAAIPST
jgi:hypothetical protein